MLAEHTLSILHADILFQGADAIDNKGGVYSEDMMVAQVDQEMRRHADICCILTDSTKTGNSALTKNGSLKEVDYFITDNRLSPELKKTYAALGPKIIMAGNFPQ
jgi:DeoR/GlpR family transcriptional regulator of sugar metabolism